MVVNVTSLLNAAPIADMVMGKRHEHGVSSGLGEAGYDIRIKQDIKFLRKMDYTGSRFIVSNDGGGWTQKPGRFIIASAIEKFQMPNDMIGIVHDKSSWARNGLSVFNTVIEPGWEGYLTLELVYHGEETLHVPAGAGIAQVVFHRTTDFAQYEGKYQHQADRPVEAIASK